MSDWGWDGASRRYRDNTTGRYISAASERAIRDDFAQRKSSDVATLAGQVARGDVTVSEWERRMQRSIRELHGTEFAFGRGGRKQVSETEWRQLGAVVSEQERYLAQFAAAIARGDLSAAQIAARASMYADAARSSYERGKAATFDGLQLPAFPGDGGDGCVCLSNCNCTWEITEADDAWSAVWTLGASEHCAGCIGRAGRYNPFLQMRTVAA